MQVICNANDEFTNIVAHQGQHMIHDIRHIKGRSVRMVKLMEL